MLIVEQAGLTSLPAISPFSGEIKPGELLAIVGPNGAGKSTLLSMLSGFRACQQGRITLDDKPLSAWPITELANRRALVAQQELPGFDWQTQELVSLGSNPSKALIAELLSDLDLTHLALRSVLSLSGGERQRVMIARGACQLLARRISQQADGGLLLLDEPTSALDIGQQQRLMRKLRNWAEQRKMAIVCVLHDLNLASLYANQVWLIHKGERIAQGKPQHVLTPQMITDVYGVELLTAQRSTTSTGFLSLAP